ncbi:hypothetical protein [Streptacidiphilus sp. MAP12-20]|uniref:hypothetical protein n=1 Tax=Streptacidiphilus sp. MAP12-20 TaxID=3156299 RepID=UPI00351524E9
MSLPGADELFRTTGGTALTPVPRAPDQSNGSAASPAPGPSGEPRRQASASGSASASEEGRPADPAGEHGAVAAPSSAPSVPGPSRGDAGSATKAAQAASDAVSQPSAARRKPRAPRSRPTGRERHEEKITVYVSAEELIDLEHARLVLRGEYGLAVDRGRIVREAVAVVLADLEQRGEASILVRRLRGR